MLKVVIFWKKLVGFPVGPPVNFNLQPSPACITTNKTAEVWQEDIKSLGHRTEISTWFSLTLSLNEHCFKSGFLIRSHKHSYNFSFNNYCFNREEIYIVNYVWQPEFGFVIGCLWPLHELLFFSLMYTFSCKLPMILI